MQWNTTQNGKWGDTINQLLSSINPQKQELAVNHMAPLFIVTHNPETGVQQSTSNASAGSLAAAMGNVVSWESPCI